ncbi:unknown [Clostridium sp. CAG:768]|nr:unknown [Clostridium sp. CAG:768]
MHINNVSQKTSLSMPIMWGIFSIIYTVALLLAYFMNVSEAASIESFCNWVKDAFNTVFAIEPDGFWMAWVLFIILPLVVYLGFILSIITRQKALKEFNSKLNLKSIDFLQGRINFNFNRPQYNFVCGYSDINSLELTVITDLVSTKYGYTTALKEIVLNFKVLNNKTFYLSNTSSFPMQTIYKIIDYTRSVNNFTYNFRGPGNTEDIKEKIDTYLNKGFKQILSNQVENNFKYLSIVLFIIGTTIAYTAKDVIESAYKNNLFIVCLPFFVMIIASFIIDIWLIADKLRERKYRG